MEKNIIRLTASEGMYFTDGKIIGKEILCLESAKDRFHEVTQEEYDKFIEKINLKNNKKMNHKLELGDSDE